MRALVQGETSFEEAVTVNQRALIDKILARYSQELTLFRELCQNADDAKATRVQIRFQGISNNSFAKLSILNNGMPFQEADWSRIKSIADGNPDESKVGFFGVGFYSVFSLSEEPTVLSGDKALAFHWRKDALFVTNGKIPEKGNTVEDSTLLGLVKQKWTLFDLPVRTDCPAPELPSPRQLAAFFFKCLMFCDNLEAVEAFYDGKPLCSVDRTEIKVETTTTPSNVIDPKQFMSLRNSNLQTCMYTMKIDKDIFETKMTRARSEFAVEVPDKFKQAMFRVTKKNPPKLVKVQLLFELGWTDSQKFDFLPGRKGLVYIGAGPTLQTSGTKCHCSAPFMPTMERNAMDLSDPTLRTWNHALLWCVGVVHRLAYEKECRASQMISATFAIKPTSPVPQVAEIIAAGFFNGLREAPTVWTNKGPQNAGTCRSRDASGELASLITDCVSIVEVPEIPKSSISTQAKSAFGSLFSMLTGTGGSSATTNSIVEEDTQEYLCRMFVEQLQKRGFLRVLDVRDLVKELETRELRSVEEVCKLLTWLEKRNTNSKAHQKPENNDFPFHCQWCGNSMVIDGTTLAHKRAEIRRQQREHTNSLFNRMFSGPLPQAKFSIICSRCKHEAVVDMEVCDTLDDKESMAAYPNRNILKIAKFQGRGMTTFRRYVSQPMTKRIKTSCDKGGIDDMLITMMWSNKDAQDILPTDISEKFSDKQLKVIGEGDWVHELYWTDWATMLFTLLHAKPKLESSHLAIASNILRVLAYANANHEISNPSILESYLRSIKCTPTKTNELMKPTETYLGMEAAGGFSSLHVAVVFQSLEDGTFKMDSSAPRETALKDFMTAIGVKIHVDLAFIFQQFNDGALGWNRQEILSYISTMQTKIKEHEMGQLARSPFLPAAEFRDGKCYPTLRSHKGEELHFPSREIWDLGVPVVYSMVQEGIELESMLGHQIPSETRKLLEHLGVNRYPKLELLLQLQSSSSLKYLVQNMRHYERAYSADTIRSPIIPCTNGVFQPPSVCFINENAAILTNRPCVDVNILSASEAKILGVREHPSSPEILQSLQRRAVSRENSEQLFEYLSTRLATFHKRELDAMSRISFIPMTDGQNFAAPNSVFFRDDPNVPGKYEGLFTYVGFQSSAANMFLRSVGVRSEPHPDELALELSTGDNAEIHVQRIGFEMYLQMLRFLAIEWRLVSPAARSALSRAKCLVGVVQTSEDTDQIVYKMERCDAIFIADNDVMNRMFMPLVAPQEDILERLYGSIGSVPLSSSVETRSRASPPFQVTELTTSLESKIRSRVQLFLFKRPLSDFVPSIHQWIEHVNSKNKHFIYEVRGIERVMKFGHVTKSRKCTALAMPNSSPASFCIVREFSIYELANELCSQLLKKGTLHDNLLWSTIIQSSDEVLRDQGFPVSRKVTPMLHAAKPPAQVMGPPPKSNAPDAKTEDVVKGEQNNLLKEAMPTAAVVPSPPQDAIPVAKEVPEERPKMPPKQDSSGSKKAGGSRKSLRQILSSVLPNSIDSKKMREYQKLAEEEAAKMDDKQLQEMQKQFSSLGQNAANGATSAVGQSEASRPPTQMRHQHQQQGTNRSNLLVDREARHQFLQQGVKRCNKGGNESTIAQQGQQRPVSYLDDLHDHDLIKTPFVYCGLECWIESSHASQMSIFESNAHAANAFAQLLSLLAVQVFSLPSVSVCHLYYDSAGSTAAFNRGGALYFNFYMFLGQMNGSGWELKTIMGDKLQPQIIPPSEALVEWFAIFSHELAHNHVHLHDAHFANVMMHYWTEFLPSLVPLIESIDAIYGSAP